VPYLVYLAIFALSALVAGASPSHARADALVSARNFLEFGKRNADAGDQFIVGLGLVADVTFGKAKPRAFRIGPALELRTVDFASLEAAAGGAVLIPMPGELAFGLYGLIGAAARKNAPDGAVGIGKVTWGFRGYPYNSWYGWGLNLYGSGRKHLGNQDLVEWTGGLEVDVQFTVLMPVLAIRNLVARDPYKEKPREEEPEARDEPAAEGAPAGSLEPAVTEPSPGVLEELEEAN
jgi:hypothetical protein